MPIEHWLVVVIGVLIGPDNESKVVFASHPRELVFGNERLVEVLPFFLEVR